MNKILVGICLILLSSLGFANQPKTNLHSKWTCTTNASTASTDSDRTADDKMAKNQTSASKAFNFATQHCRDCTKITCENSAATTTSSSY